MPILPFGVTAADFRWCTGIEDTFVIHTRPGLRPLDEYALMGHYDRWREDLGLARATGARMIRWGIPWYRVEPEPGRFDWSWTDDASTAPTRKMSSRDSHLWRLLAVSVIVCLWHKG